MRDHARLAELYQHDLGQTCTPKAGSGGDYGAFRRKRPSYLATLTALAGLFMMPYNLPAQESKGPAEGISYWKVTQGAEPAHPEAYNKGPTDGSALSEKKGDKRRFFLFEGRNLLKFGLLEAAAAANVGTTRHCMEQHNGYEANPIMRPFSGSWPAMYAAESGINLAMVYASDRLGRSESPFLRRAGKVILLSGMGSHTFSTVFNNAAGCR